MNALKTPLQLEWMPGTRNFKLIRSLKYDDDYGFSIVVPRGSTTDFASIPRVLRSIWSPYDPRWIVASIIHDYLYREGVMPRAEADDKFRDIMRQSGAGRNRFFLDRGVRFGGSSSYDPKNRKSRKKKAKKT